jgi:hypothetical protein
MPSMSAVACESSDCCEWLISSSGARHAKPPLWPAGTCASAYAANRTGAVENVIDADPVADAVRAIMATRVSWMGMGTASDLFRAAADLADGKTFAAGIDADGADAKSPSFLLL